MKIVRNIILLLLASSLFWLLTGCQSDTSPRTKTAEPAFELKVDILGKIHILSLDSEGRLIASAELASTDGAVNLSIDKGTKLLDRDGKPLQFIQVAIDPTLPISPEGAYIVGAVYDLKPYEATFSPPFQLTLKYNADELPEGVKERNVCIASYEDAKWSIVRYQQVDTETHSITADIDRFGRVAILVPGESTSTEPPPKLSTTPAPKPDLTSLPLGKALSSGKPTLAEFGSSTCVPCKQMKPILERLAVEYEGKLNVVIVEVYEQRSLTQQYGIMAIPTQIVFDRDGKEVTRHMGFWAKEEIIAQLKKMGIE